MHFLLACFYITQSPSCPYFVLSCIFLRDLMANVVINIEYVMILLSTIIYDPNFKDSAAKYTSMSVWKKWLGGCSKHEE